MRHSLKSSMLAKLWEGQLSTFEAFKTMFYIRRYCLFNNTANEQKPRQEQV